MREATLEPSGKPWDWLGHGIYFWEHGPESALQWAAEKKQREEITEPAVLWAIIHLGKCFDLLDTRYTEILTNAFPKIMASIMATGERLPGNEPRDTNDEDTLLRRLDCFVLNWTLDRLEAAPNGIRFDSVRGIFEKGKPSFPGSMIRTKSHTQIAVRNPDCIVGYFVPNSTHT